MLCGVVIAVMGCAILLTSLSHIGWAEEVEKEWTELSLEELEALDVLMVTSVSKKAQKLTESPAAIYVITQEDIRRSGATSIPEALRMVPGLHVVVHHEDGAHGGFRNAPRELGGDGPVVGEAGARHQVADSNGRRVPQQLLL